MKQSLNDVLPMPSTHKVGMKWVLLAAEESGCTITQIAITGLRAGEVAKAHVRENMVDEFYVLDGRLDIKLNDEFFNCKAEKPLCGWRVARAMS